MSQNGQGLDYILFRIRNAGPFRSENLNLKNRGLVRLSGPNGSGKSTLIHLLTQVIHGTAPTKLSKNELALEEKDFLLELTFEKNGSTYVAAQSIKSKCHNPKGEAYGTGTFLFRDGEDISMHKQPDTQKLIQATVGWSLEEWYGYVYLAQQTAHTLIRGTRSERQNYFSVIFNIAAPMDRLQKVYAAKADELSSKVKDLEKQKQELSVKENILAGRTESALEEQILQIKEELEMLGTQLVRLRREQSKWDQLVALQAKLNSLPAVDPEIDFVNINKDIDQLTQRHFERESLLQKIADLKQSIAQIETYGEGPVELPADLETVLAGPDINLAEDQKKITELKSIKLPVDFPAYPSNLEDVLATPDIDLKWHIEQIRAIQTRPAAPAFSKPTQAEYEKLVHKRSEITIEISEIKRQLKHLEFHGEQCPTCGTSLDSGNRVEKRKELQGQLEEMTFALNAIEPKIKRTSEQIAAWTTYEAAGPDRTAELPVLQKAVDTFKTKQEFVIVKRLYEQKEKVAELPALELRVDQYRKKLEYRILQDSYAESLKQQAERERLLAEINKLQNSVTPDESEILKKLKNAFAQQTERVQYTAQIEALKNAKDLTQKILNLEEETQTLQGQLGSVEKEKAEIRSLVTSIQSLQFELSKQEGVYREQKKCEILAKAFGKAGQLRELQLKRFSKYLEDALLMHTIRQLPNYRFQVIVDDGVDILASKNGGKYYDVRTFSGGEAGSLSVAFLFALDDLLPPSRRSPLKIVDEVESAFDKDKRPAFIANTLPELRKRAKTVILISHSPEADSGNFDVAWDLQSNGTLVETIAEERSMGETA